MELTRRQQEIVRTALELIAAGGIQNLTIRNLADRLGLTEPASTATSGTKRRSSAL